MKTLTEIKSEVDSRAAMIGVSGHRSLPTYGQTEDSARPHIEVDSLGYHFVVVERGHEFSRITTRDLDELLYHIFQTLTFTLAFDYELAHRIETQDCRRLGFQKQVEILTQLSESWGRRRAQEHEQILQKHPFDDFSAIRARLSTQVGWTKACEKYPLAE
jgi:hypothetical protein